jgi:2-methylcitrate dehydratase PrpD
MGIVYTQTSGNEQSALDGAMTKPLQLGFAAKAGVVSAILSRHEVVGPKNVLEGKYGYFNLYEHGEYDPSQLIAGLGKDFKGIDLSIKPYPSCRLTHPAIDAAQKIMESEGIVGPSDGVKPRKVLLFYNVFYLMSISSIAFKAIDTAASLIVSGSPMNVRTLR